MADEELNGVPGAEIAAEAEPETQAPSGADAKAEYLRMTVNSGIRPLEMRFSQINNCYRKLPIAYRSFTYMNSVIEGVVPPEKYSYAADGTDRGVRLSIWNIEEAMRSIEAFILAGRHIEYVTARVSPKLVLEEDFYAFIQKIIEKNGFQFPDLLCLEFPRTVLFEDEEKVRMALLSMKLLKVKTMLAGCGEKDSPITQLVSLPFDYVVLAPWLTKLTDDRSKSQVVASLSGFLRELPAMVVADGVLHDEQISLLSRADCAGYIPSPAFVGQTEHGRLRMPLEEAVAQKEEVEI